MVGGSWSIVRGFTMIDFLVAVAVFLSVTGLISINLLSSQHKVNLTSAVDILVADLAGQQLKAMSGDTEGRGVNDAYGIYFGTTSYTVFHGLAYNPGDSSNFTVNLPVGITLANVTWPTNMVIFGKGSGEVVGWSGSTNSLQITSVSDGRTKTITVNRLGVVDNVN